MSGPIGAMMPRGDQDNVLSRGPAEVAPPAPSIFEFDWDATKASAEQSFYDSPGRSHELRQGELAAHAAELARLTGKRPSDYYFDMPGEPVGGAQVDETTFWNDLATVRRTRPDALKELGADRVDYDRRRVVRLQAGRQNREQRMAQGGLATNLLGGAAGAFTDPINLMTMPIGGGGRTIAMQVLRAGALNAAIEAGEQPLVALERGQQGSELTLGEAAMNVAGAGIGGAGLQGLGIGLGKSIELGAPTVARGARKLYERAVPLDYRMAQAVKKDLGGDWLMTPEQAAAVHVIERGAEVDATNPFPDTYAGLDAHAARIDQVLGELAALPRPTSEAAPAGLSVRARALSSTAGVDALSRGTDGYNPAEVKALIRGPESAGDDRAVNRMGSSASGRYQFVKGTFKSVYAKVYGGDAETAWHQRRFEPAVQEALMDRLLADNAAVLRQQRIPVDNGNIYVMHVLGSGDGPRLLKARGDTPVAELLSPAIVRQNPTYFGGGKSASEALAIIRSKVGGRGDGMASARDATDPVVDEPAIVAREPALDAERPEIDVRDDVRHAGLVDTMRGIAADRSRSLNRIGEMAEELGASEIELRGALDSLVGRGELTVTKSGVYRRAAGAGNAGPEDMLRFIAKRGGLSYDGLGAGELATSKGHNLRNSGNLDTFVPGAGPLLRPGGRGLDEMGEALHDAGYFGPPETTPRPSETELITLLDEVIRRKEKRLSFFDTARRETIARERAAPEGYQTEAHFEAERGQWKSSAERVIGRDLTDDEFAAVLAIRDEGLDEAYHGRDQADAWDEDNFAAGVHLDPYLRVMVNRELDAALEDAYLEIEDPLYDLDLADEARTPAGGREGSAADAGDPRAGEGGAGTRQDGGQEQQLSPAARDEAEAAGAAGPVIVDPATAAKFDDGAGEGTKAAVDSMWHDLRAEFVDPNIAIRQALEAQLGADAPMRANADQDGTIGLGLFDAADQPKFDLEDGKPPRTVAEIDEELAAQEAAIKAIRDCQT